MPSFTHHWWKWGWAWATYSLWWLLKWQSSIHSHKKDVSLGTCLHVQKKAVHGDGEGLEWEVAGWWLEGVLTLSPASCSCTYILQHLDNVSAFDKGIQFTWHLLINVRKISVYHNKYFGFSIHSSAPRKTSVFYSSPRWFTKWLTIFKIYNMLIKTNSFFPFLHLLLLW